MSSPKPKAKSTGLTLADINARWNPNVVVPNKIRAALKALGAKAVDENEFRLLSGVGSNQLPRFLDQFEEYIIVVRENGRPRRLWTGDPKFATEARAALEQ